MESNNAIPNQENTKKFSDLLHLKTMRWNGLPSGIFFVMLAIALLLIYLPDASGTAGGYLRNNFIGIFANIGVVSILLVEVGDRIPFWNKYVGGGFTLAMVGVAFLASYNILPELIVSEWDVWFESNPANFLEMYICLLLAGSVLTIDRKQLLASLGGYFPMVIIGLAGATLGGILVGLIFGRNIIDIIMEYVIPIMGAGIGSGAIPMKEMVGNAGVDANLWFTNAVVTLTIANIGCIIIASVFNQWGLKNPKMTGESLMMAGGKEVAEDSVMAAEMKKPAEAVDVAAALVFAGTAFVLSSLIGDLWKQVFPKFAIHRLAFMVIILTVLNVTNIVPVNVKRGVKTVQRFVAVYLSGPVLAGAGLTVDFRALVSNFSIASLFIIIGVLAGACLFSLLTARLFKFNPIDITITSTLCMANSAGAGDIMVLGACDRMHLLPYAQISTRIGGAAMLIAASAFFSLIGGMG